MFSYAAENLRAQPVGAAIRCGGRNTLVVRGACLKPCHMDDRLLTMAAVGALDRIF